MATGRGGSGHGVVRAAGGRSRVARKVVEAVAMSAIDKPPATIAGNIRHGPPGLDDAVGHDGGRRRDRAENDRDEGPPRPGCGFIVTTPLLRGVRQTVQ
ncbi:hypothetical protein [Nocardia australiensis]|uniref:hypothetical protein n=1 Tax=Nocardia australiensis TaxID=2887191 RepID=UPI001D13C275|nr:hypothetical protein [Nocardia australiensis]